MATSQKPPTGNKPKVDTRPAHQIPTSSEVMSKGWKRFWIISGIIVAVILAVYGLWRLSGGSFKPKADSSCTSATRTQLQDTAAVSPNDFATQIKYADFVYDCREYSVAAQYYNRAVVAARQAGSSATSADRQKAQFGLALSYLYNQNLKEAQEQFKILTDEQPNNAVAFYMYGVSLQNDNKDKAIEMWQKAIAINPGSETAKTAQKAIEEARKK
jgi:tetratricopeptide (TPR) repeat protein